MKVLHVIPSVALVHGGPSSAIAMFERTLASAGVAVTTATTDDDGPGQKLGPDAQPSNINGAVRIYARKRLQFYTVAPGLVPWLWRQIRDFDVVHVHALFSFTSTVAALMARWRRVPYIVRPLGTLAQYGIARRRPLLKRLSFALLENRILRQAAAVHFTSEAEWEEAKLLKLPLRGVVIPLGVKAEGPGDAQLLLQEQPTLANRKIVLYLSRLDPKKNIEVLLKAFVILQAQRKDVALLIAGDGIPAYVESLKAHAMALGIGPSVFWTGHIVGARKASALAAAHVFVLPSLSENFGVAAAEAMICGKACVLGQGVAIAQRAAMAGAGIAVAPDAEPIARALAELLADRARRDAMGDRARDFARREFSEVVMADRLKELYNRVIQAKQSSE